jgi:outer membrane protein W
MKFRLALALILVSFSALPLFAQSNEIGLWYAGSRVSNTNDGDARLKFDTGSGSGFSAGHYWGNHIATVLAYTSTEADGTISVAGTPVIDAGKLKLKLFTVTADWHFARKAMLDPYAGIGFVDVQVDDLTSNDLVAAGAAPVAVENDSGWSANAGVNVNFARHWGVGIDGKYFRYHPRTTSAGVDTGRLDLNPIVVSVGLRLRF